MDEACGTCGRGKNICWWGSLNKIDDSKNLGVDGSVMFR